MGMYDLNFQNITIDDNDVAVATLITEDSIYDVIDWIIHVKEGGFAYVRNDVGGSSIVYYDSVCGPDIVYPLNSWVVLLPDNRLENWTDKKLEEYGGEVNREDSSNSLEDSDLVIGIVEEYDRLRDMEEESYCRRWADRQRKRKEAGGTYYARA